MKRIKCHDNKAAHSLFYLLNIKVMGQNSSINLTSINNEKSKKKTKKMGGLCHIIFLFDQSNSAWDHLLAHPFCYFSFTKNRPSFLPYFLFTRDPCNIHRWGIFDGSYQILSWMLFTKTEFIAIVLPNNPIYTMGNFGQRCSHSGSTSKWTATQHSWWYSRLNLDPISW